MMVAERADKRRLFWTFCPEIGWPKHSPSTPGRRHLLDDRDS